MSGHNQWSQAEVALVGLLFAAGWPPEMILGACREAGFPPRTRQAIANAKTQRADVKDAVTRWTAELGNGPLEPDHPELRDLERKLVAKQSEVGSLLKKLKESDKRANQTEAVVEEIRSSVESYRNPPTIVRSPQVEGLTPATLVSINSDLHADEVVDPDGAWGLEDSDFDIKRIRVERWTELNIDYATRHLPAHNFEEIVVLGLGDNLQGDIHGHGPRNHFRSTPKAAVAVGDLLADSLYTIRKETGLPISVVAVSGNHPRRSARKDFDGPQDNFDYISWVQAATRLRDVEGIEIILPNSWTAFVEVRGRVWCLNHGDDVIGFAGLPWYGFARKNGRVQALLQKAGTSVDYFAYGHYHTPAMLVNSWHNGAFGVTDSYAVERVQGANDPLQWSFVQDEERGIINALPLYVRDPERESAFREGQYTPSLGSVTGLDLVRPATSGQRSLHIIKGSAA